MKKKVVLMAFVSVLMLSTIFPVLIAKSAPLNMGLGSWTKGTVPASQYVNITQISTPYGNGISVSTIESEHVGYYFFGYYNQETFPAGLVVNITGYFRYSWGSNPFVELYVLSANASTILRTDIRILDYAQGHMAGDWYYMNNITDMHGKAIWVEEEFRIAFGRYSPSSNMPEELQISWASIDITIPPAPHPPSPLPVGGKATPINMPIIKPELQIPWIWLSTILLAVAVMTVVYVKKRKRDTEIIS